MRKKLSWIGLLGLSVTAVVLLRVDRSYSLEAPPEDPEHELKYVCIGDIAVELDADKPSRYTHDLNLELPFDTLKQRCRPPLPQFSETTISVTAPARGYAAVLENVPADPAETLRMSKKALLGEGWRETAGSRELGAHRPDRPAMTFEMENAWLMTVVVPKSDGEGSYLLMAGEWPRAELR